MKKLPLLGDITPAQFLRDYWHKKPLVIRQAIPGFKPLLSVEALAELATHDHVESRLVTAGGGHWDMQTGPLEAIPSREQKEWTLLVQGVNLHDARADALLRQFRFIPDARLDDLMVSFATDGGGVGPHFDSYDVFLLQAAGQRRWRIGPQKDLSVVEGLPLKILAQFKPDSIDLPGRYADPDLETSAKPAEIPRHMLDSVAEEMNKVRFTDDDVTIFLGEHLSEPKHNVFFKGPAKPLAVGKFQDAATKKGLSLSRKTQMLYRGKHVFINGESFAIGRADKATLEALANARALDGAALASASEDVLDALYTWYTDGWIELG